MEKNLRHSVSHQGLTLSLKAFRVNTAGYFEVSNICKVHMAIWGSSASTSFHDPVLSQRNKLLNPYLSCRSLRYTTRKSLQRSPGVRLFSTGVYYCIFFHGSMIFFLAQNWHHPADIWSAFNQIYLKYKTMQMEGLTQEWKIKFEELFYLDVTAKEGDLFTKKCLVVLCGHFSMELCSVF